MSNTEPEKYLVFQLAGLMGSWGGPACGQRRHSFRHPTKSAIIGLISAACGIERSDLTRLKEMYDNLHVATHELRCEHYLSDFHTIQTPSQLDFGKLKKLKHWTRKDELTNEFDENNTVLSTREYWQDLYYRIAITVDDTAPDWCSLENIKSRLLEPIFHLYLGRKSCPLSLPLNPIITSAPDLIALFEHAKTIMKIPEFVSDPFFKSRKYLNRKGRIFCEPEMVNGINIDFKKSVRRDVPADRERGLWHFNEREELELLIGRNV
jgi:CRISPR system Cascade subunit CasD